MGGLIGKLTSFPLFVAGDVLYKDVPDFDFERTPHYELVISVSDGNFDPVSGNLSIIINDINEPPIIWNLPQTIELLEDVTMYQHLLDVSWGFIGDV